MNNENLMYIIKDMKDKAKSIKVSYNLVVLKRNL